MTKNYNYLINFFLSIFGIFLSFFYFGYNNYHYPQFELINIFRSGLMIALLLTLLIIILSFITSKQKFIDKIFIYSLHSGVIFITYHYLFRFADISYFEFFKNIFSINNLYIKIIFYFYPFILSLIIFFILSKKKIQNLSKFFLIILILLNSLSIIRIFTIYGNIERSSINLNDYKNFKSFDKDKIDYKKKVFLLIFDEFDQYYLEKNLYDLSYLKKIYNQSYIHKNFYAPAKFTMDSIPAILTGNSIKKTFIKNGNFSFLNLDNQKINFNYKNSLFNQNNINKKITSSIYGLYHPYCRIFKVKTCYDVYNFKSIKISFFDSIKILSDLIYLNKILKIEPFQAMKNDDKRLSKFFYLNNNDFLLSDSDIIYIHYPYPHLPLKTKNIIQLDNKLNNLSDFEKNFWLVENTLNNAKDILSRFENSLLIITSDHWFRESSQNKALPSVFISKIIGDNSSFQNISDNNASSIKGLIDLYFKDKINNNFDIKTYFNNQTNHKTYVREN